MSEFKVGDTVDPRTLPVGAVFRHVGWDCQFRVTESGLTAESFDGRFSGLNIGSASAILLSLPTPKRPPCDACGEESNPACSYIVDGQQSPLCNACWASSSVELTATIRDRRAAQASPERPIVEPMSAASENPPRKSTVPSSLPTYDQIAGWLGAEWVMTFKGWELTVPARWVGQEEDFHPSPWLDTHTDDERFFRCYLRHTSGQRVEVTAPREPPGGSGWCIWFGLIRNQSRITGARSEEYQRYQAHVRWLDPDTKTITGSESATRNAAEAASAAPEKPEPVVPEGLRCPFCTSRSHSFGFMNPDGTGARAIICDECDYRAPDSDWFGQPSCSSCKQPFWAGRPSCFYDTLCGDCFRAGTTESADHLTNGLDTRIAEVAEPEVRVEDMPGAWQSSSWEDVS